MEYFKEPVFSIAIYKNVEIVGAGVAYNNSFSRQGRFCGWWLWSIPDALMTSFSDISVNQVKQTTVNFQLDMVR
jgi:hypothetical protein